MTEGTALRAYAGTRRAGYTGFVVQAIVNNLAPRLFVVFHTELDVPVAQLGLLAALNFGVQLLTDLVAMFFVDRVGYRRPIVAAHVLATVGLVLLAVLPGQLGDPFLGLCLAVVVYAMGGGLLEVLVSPIVEHLPAAPEEKASGMALLHSFYCWGQLATVVGTTVLVGALGDESWALLPLLWAVVPAVNTVVFARVPGAVRQRFVVMRCGRFSMSARPFHARLTRCAATSDFLGERASSQYWPVSATMPTSICA